VLTDPDAAIWGGELVLRDDVAVGQVTSGAWGEAVGGCVGLAYVQGSPDVVRTGKYEVNVGGQVYPATVHLRPPFDPAGDRIKGRYPAAAVTQGPQSPRDRSHPGTAVTQGP